jgi:hypothetical protein
VDEKAEDSDDSSYGEEVNDQMEEIIEEERDEDLQDITGDELLENKGFVNQGSG